jgi:BNR repeat-like domain
MKRGSALIFMLALGLFCLTPDARADWTPAKRLTWTSGNSSSPAIAIDSSSAVHVVWSDDTPGNLELYHKKSTDGGTTWSVNKRITWTAGSSVGQAIGTDSSNAVHVVWSDDTPGNHEIYYKKSTDGGTTWSVAQRLTWASSVNGDMAMAIGSDDAIHVAWADEISNTDIFYMRSTDGGTSWSAAKGIGLTPFGSYKPALAPDANNTIYIVWEEYTSGSWEIFWKKSTDGGITWGANKRLTWNSGSSYAPSIAIDSSHAIHVAWYDNTPGNYEVCYKRSTDGGVNWSGLKKLSGTSDLSEQPAIALDSGNAIHIVWDEWQLGEVYYRQSTDGGITWTATTRLTWTSGRSEYTAMAIGASDTIHVVWQDETPYNREIYYKRGN